MSEKSKPEAKKAGQAKAGEKQKGSGKLNAFFARIGKFFREYRSELKKISWPTFAEVVKNTAITMVVVLMIGAVIWLFDWGVSSLRNALIDSVKAETSENGDFSSDIVDALNEFNASASDAGVVVASPTDGAAE